MSGVESPQQGASYIEAFDGARIALWSEGWGRPVVYLPHLPWWTPGMLAVGERLPPGGSSGRPATRTVRYDPRGLGLSGGLIDLSLPARLRDLSAVVDHVAAGPVALVAPVHSGPTAIAYAAHHPDRVSHLILCHAAYASAADFFADDRMRGRARLIEDDWWLFARNAGMHSVEWSSVKQAHALTATILRHFTSETATAMMDELRGTDVTPLLSRVEAPTLVIRRRDFPIFSEVPLSLVADIKGARLLVVQGSGIPFRADWETLAAVIEGFVRGWGHGPIEDPASHARSRDGHAHALSEPLNPREVEVLELVSAGLHTMSVNRYFRGHIVPPLDKAQRPADALAEGDVETDALEIVIGPLRAVLDRDSGIVEMSPLAEDWHGRTDVTDAIDAIWGLGTVINASPDFQAEVSALGERLLKLVTSSAAIYAQQAAKKTVAGESSERLRAPLTPRELEVLRLVAAGMSNDEVAGELTVASTTVKKHLHSVYSKLRARNRTHAVAQARELDLLQR